MGVKQILEEVVSYNNNIVIVTCANFDSSDLSSVDDYSHVLANALEAIIGAIYLDGGLEESKKVVAKLLFPEEVCITKHNHVFILWSTMLGPS